jgi:hypothetical protein
MQITKRSGPFRTEMKARLYDELSTVNVATQSSPATSHYCQRKNASGTTFEQHQNRTEADVSIYCISMRAIALTHSNVHDNNKMIR